MICELMKLSPNLRTSEIPSSMQSHFFSIFNGAFTGISQHPPNSFPGPLPGGGGWTGKPSQGKGPGNEVEQAPSLNYCSFIIRNNINLASSSFQHFPYSYAFEVKSDHRGKFSNFNPLEMRSLKKSGLQRGGIRTRRSPLLGACNSHNKPLQRHFYRQVYFII